MSHTLPQRLNLPQVNAIADVRHYMARYGPGLALFVVVPLACVGLIVLGRSATPHDSAGEPLLLSPALKAALDSGLSDRDAVKQVSEALGLQRRQVYAEMLRLKKDERR